MKNSKIFLPLTVFIVIALGFFFSPPLHRADAADKPQVVFTTDMGEITIELDPQQAPLTVSNFLAYVDAGFFDGTIFHRVIPGFVIQGGGFTADMVQKPTRTPIKNEADNGLRNLRGTLSMARTQDLHSATSQFFINLKDNKMLDHRPGNFGYAVFGRVSQGMDVVDAIAAVPTGNHGHYQDVPRHPVRILMATKK
ncbi:MAG: peptidyl-prolyl cis-trans isomerase [Deltaproteobacteria bacterium]|nr:peptidyl-prolyl cis-trans isomerase [Candidatus Anaeroferrophillus wilburensis]MBN2887952.1 peptidyl-prolyl cis-trans isomerase [Deltaproteobacteria bacterium]